MSATRFLRPVMGAGRLAIPTSTRGFATTSRRMDVHLVKSKAEFDDAVKKPLVVLDCFADWCAPCKAIAPVVESLSNQEANKGVHFIKLDVDEAPEVAQELGVRAMPTFYFFKNGEKVQQMMGADPGMLGKLVGKLREGQ